MKTKAYKIQVRHPETGWTDLPIPTHSNKESALRRAACISADYVVTTRVIAVRV